MLSSTNCFFFCTQYFLNQGPGPEWSFSGTFIQTDAQSKTDKLMKNYSTYNNVHFLEHSTLWDTFLYSD